MVRGSRTSPGGRGFPIYGTVLRATLLTLRSWRPILLYGFGFQLLVGVLLAPVFLWVLAEVLSLARSDVVLNYDLQSLALSVEGVALAFLWALMACSLAVLGVGGGVLITAAGHEGRKISLGWVVRRVVGSLHRIPGLGVAKLATWTFFLLPLIGAAVTAVIAALLAPFGAGPVEHWIPDEVREIAWVVPAALALLAVSYALYVRWCLTFHCLVLERISLTKALRRSAELIRGSFWRVARLLLLHNVTVGLFFGIVSILLGALDGLLIDAAAGEQGPLFRYVVALLVVANTITISAATIFATGRGISLLTILYHRLHEGPVTVDWATDDLDPTPGASRRRLAAVLLILLVLGGATALTVPEVAEELEELDSAVTVTAHRGNSLAAPENTLAAIEAAIDSGADFAEFDVQQATDGAVVVMHDQSVERTAGVDKKVYEMTLEELKALDVGSWKDERFRGERIPTLGEVLELAKGRIKLNIELKVHGRESGFAEAVVEAIRVAEFRKDCVIQSNNLPILQRVRELDPEIPIGIIVAAKIGRLSKLDVDFYSVQPEYASIAFIRSAHLGGRDVWVWTINEENLMKLFIDRGVDSIITDRPGQVLEILDDRSEADEIYAAIMRLFRR